MKEKYIVALSDTELDGLIELTRKDSLQGQKVINALMLLICEQGEFNVKRNTGETIVEVLQISKRNRVLPIFFTRKFAPIPDLSQEDSELRPSR